MPARDELDTLLAELGDAFTVPELATLLEVHPATIYRAIKSGRLRATTRGSGQIRQTLTKIPRDAVVDFMRPTSDAA